MAERNTEVMEMVERELAADPNVSNQKLYDMAVAIDRSISEMSRRQFNAVYPLQVKRAVSVAVADQPATAEAVGATPRVRRPRSKKASETSFNSIRKIMLEFAKGIADAETKGAIVDVVSGVDDYVTKVVAALK